MIAFLLTTASLPGADNKDKAAPSGAEAAAIDKIEKSGGSVRQIAQNDERKEVDFHLQGSSVTDAQVAPVAGLTNVVRVHLGKTGITDAALAYLKPLAKLSELHLEETKITDKGLAQLKGLSELTYLNLYGTGITDAGLAQLTGLKNLRSIYLWQTKVTDAGAAKLKQALPNLEIVRGWDVEKKPEPAKAETPKEETKK
jgi:Leucine-rich repeat (LRR) protein